MASKQNLTSDQRFSRVTKDPRFWEMPEKDKKIKIDKRFRSMFHDEKFNLKYTVDKRGRPMNHNTNEDLKRFYDLSDSDEEDLSDEKTSPVSKTRKQRKGKTKVKKQLEAEPKKTKSELEKAKTRHKTDECNDEDQRLKGKGGKPTKEVAQDQDELQPKKKTVTNIPQKTKGKSLKAGIELQPLHGSDEDESELDGDDTEGSSNGSRSEGESSQVHDEDVGSDEETEEEEESGDDDLGKSDEEEGADSGTVEEDSDSGPDLARGKGNIETSSEDEDDEDDIVGILPKDPELEHAWREMDKDAPRGDQVTKRLAVCNMDWDRLKAKDLLALFTSFKPKGGVVLSVKVYPSEFGKERLKAEELHGPVELKNISEDVTEDHGIKEKLREYQFKRLKYFYAVIECDSTETANTIYEECDGLEFESSCSFVDLRFIPDDVEFNDEPKDFASDVDLSAYKPKYFTSAAMATSKVDITWDETDHERITSLNRPFKKEEILDMDFQAYLASSSEEEEKDVSDIEVTAADEASKSKKGQKDDEEQIARYRELLKGIQDKDKKHEDNDMEMEIKWIPGLKESAELMVKNKLEGKDELTPWEKYLQKQKDKRKMKKRKKGNLEEDKIEEDEAPSDVDFNDPYFSEELRKPGLKKKSARDKEEAESSGEEAEKEKQRAEIALLMMDDVEDDRKHFNYDRIVEQQNLSKKKKKQLKKKEELLEDGFQINVEDTRFQAMYTSHLYNVDPSDPSFKKTKATDRVLEEKARRREQEQSSHVDAVKRHERDLEDVQKKGKSAVKAADLALTMLVKSVKNKTQQFQASKKQKMK
ncbi:ESF1 homolog [Ascaphus truei]|uniref:ESF1 homolog n=1 Tax=Ascaphus truei TaxID=8439 RepID=UPI003F5A6BA4